MELELIPVIEIGYSNQDIPLPGKGPYWEFPDIWDNYNAACYSKAGFEDKLTPYLPGFPFYKLEDINDKNLAKLVLDHTQEMRAGKYDREEVSPFSGGYILRINNIDKYFPQCCGDLSDIHYWIRLGKKETSVFYNGHPEPKVRLSESIITFDFSPRGFDEPFVPNLQDKQINFDIIALNKAIDKVQTELADFKSRLLKINASENINIESIEKLLIWGDD